MSNHILRYMSLLLLILCLLSCQRSNVVSCCYFDEDFDRKPDWVSSHGVDNTNCDIIHSNPAYYDDLEAENLRSDLFYDRLSSNGEKLTDPLNPIPESSSTIKSEESPSPVNQVSSDKETGVKVVINNDVDRDVRNLLDQKNEIKIQPLSPIESLYNQSEGKLHGRSVAQWGYQVFTELKSDQSLAPIDPEYIIGPGDEILVKTSGSIDFDYRLVVDNNGMLFIPKIGGLSIAGVQHSKLFNKVKDLIDQEYSNYDIDVSLGRLHSIRVTVTGHVLNPGQHLVLANATLLDLLSSVGGISKEGSLRKVQIHRNDGSINEIDLYPFIAGLKEKKDITLLAGDMIVVPPIGKTAALVNPVNSGIYELLDDTNLEDLISFSGGINAFTNQKNFYLERMMPNGMREGQMLEPTKYIKLLALNDGDVVIFAKSHDDLSCTVSVTGPLVRPGIFPCSEGMRVSELLKLSEGFLIEAYLERAMLVRRIGRKGTFDQMLNDQSIQTQEEVIWIDLKAILEGGEQADIQLHRLDHLKIYTKSEVQDTPTVKVIGAVRRPGEYPLTTGLTLKELITIAGGPASDAYSGVSNIVRRTQTSEGKHYDVSLIPFNLRNVLEGGMCGQISLRNFDQVVVKKVQSLQVSVKIEGQVQFPGTYILPEGSKISDLVKAAGGILNDADLRAAAFRRKRVKDQQHFSLDHLFASTEQKFSMARDYITRDGNVSESVASQLNLQSLQKLAINMRRFQAYGRVVVDMRDDYFPESYDNLVLEDDDMLFIPKRLNSIVVVGEVFSPSAFVWHPGMSVHDYLLKSGGVQRFSDPDSIYLIMANGEVRSVHQMGKEKLLTMRPGPGDAILVPPKEMSRSRHGVWHDAIALVRDMVEAGLIGATIPRAGEREAIVGLDMGTSPRPIPTAVGAPYDTILDYEVSITAPEVN